MALLATVSLLAFRVGAVLLDPISNVSPSAGAAPGAAKFEQLASGIEWWALLLALVGLVVGAASWAIGAHSSNYQYTSAGKRAVVVSGLAALLVGAAPFLVNFFFGIGTQVHQ